MTIRKAGAQKGFLSLLGILITVAIICILFNILLKAYFRKIPLVEEIGNSDVSADNNTSDYQSIIKSTKIKINTINKQRKEQMEGLGSYGQ